MTKIKFIITLYVNTIRLLLTKIMNLYFKFKMKRLGLYKAISYKVHVDSKDVSSIGKVEQLYNSYYKSYMFDPLKGAFDWSGNIETILFRGGGDCDDMAEVFRHFLLCLYNNAHISADVRVYAFIPCTWHIIDAIQNAHVMCVTKVFDNRYVLGDYKLYNYNTLDEIKQHYLDEFFADSKYKLSVDQVIMVEIPKP